ncbi:MAG: bifunctional (p)ppGpp synthetase/guanosine-3',5'-bis(diphosphate) 3'-pyrophosphohydrolase [Gammaproteobacteria bacterium]|nr:bifunctional (p)ppGpp synthetase/guanosine-3',5'-bis(diphosphate) 3'-pyrophosphohydrolase [Gammaproteobacteria bacterium]MDE2251039.1 bifunctional (p)ppGpp synthetase/guanosine-3',5'-bis(diphosphate) 3'-pyrophosphohydrolase [Gammaproteobacteria bacterium]
MDYASQLLGLLPGTRRTPGLKDLLARVSSYLPPEQVERVRAAAEFGAAAHQGQKRLSGEPYIAHPVAAAEILAELHLDADTLIAAILHDVIEDTPTPKAEIAQRFGNDVAEIVDGVTKLDQIQFKSRQEAQAESFRKMLLAMVRDLRVILVKLADRTHNLRTMEAVPPAKRRLVARETLDIYAPVAERLGLYTIKLELEELGFRTLYPQRYRVIERALKRALGNQKEFLARIRAQLEPALKKAGIDATVETREKHLYSVYQKMQRKRAPLAEIVDVYGLRIIVDSVDTCYRTIGVVHSVYKPMPGRFKDYIAIPRVNGYQSLHTTLFGPNAVPIEVQIRTREMDQVAESGIAAHWKYKEHAGEGSAQQERARSWLTHLMQMQESGSSEEFIESVKVDLFPDKVYVFTPRGEILRLPRGATVVDFAYAVHTDIGNRCVAAKVDRRLTPLRTVLRNGQTVHIITAKGARPNPAWVNFVVTAKARSGIRHYLKGLKSNEAVELGRRLLQQSLAEFHVEPDQLEPATLAAALGEFALHSVEELYERIGLGERLAPLVARRLLPGDHQQAANGQAAPLAVAGAEGLLVTYAHCCYPLPGDPILAFLSTGRGIVIHRETCGNVADYRKHPENWLPVNWQASDGRFFNAEIRVEAANRMGLLAAVSAAISGTQTNISSVNFQQNESETATMTFMIEVRDREHLARVIRTVRRMSDVIRVVRTIAGQNRKRDPAPP